MYLLEIDWKLWALFLLASVIYTVKYEKFLENSIYHFDRSIVANHSSIGPGGYLIFGYVIFLAGVVMEIKMNVILGNIARTHTSLSSFNYRPNDTRSEINQYFWFNRYVRNASDWNLLLCRPHLFQFLFQAVVLLTACYLAILVMVEGKDIGKFSTWKYN